MNFFGAMSQAEVSYAVHVSFPQRLHKVTKKLSDVWMMCTQTWLHNGM